jgi:signal transduction histidine kinase
MEQLFKPFYRGKNRHFSEGSGIGLTLTERIVKLHGGTVSVASRPGEGTVFTIVFECA